MHRHVQPDLIAMILMRSLLSLLGLISYTESECSPTSYYRNCWIRRFPGLQVDVEESERRGAQLLHLYRDQSALNCSRACCLTPNFSCNLAVFHFNTTQEKVNCFHLHCPTLESCILRHRASVILYNVTKGVDPDLLVFGKYFSNVQVLPHQASSRLNTSEPSVSDKRQFNPPHMAPGSSTNPTTTATTWRASPTSQASNLAISASPLVSIPTTLDIQGTLPASTRQRSTTTKWTTQKLSTHFLTNPSKDSTSNVSTKWVYTASQTSTHPSTYFNIPASSSTQPKPTSIATMTVLWLSNQASTSTNPNHDLATTTAHSISQTTSTKFITQPDSSTGTTFNSKLLTITTTTVPLTSTQQSSTGKTTAHITLTRAQLNSLSLTPLTTVQNTQHVPTSNEAKVVTKSYTSTTQPNSQLTNDQTPALVVTGKVSTQYPTIEGLPEQYSISKMGTSEDDTSSLRQTTSTGLHSPAADSVTSSGLNNSPTIMEDSQPYPNDTKGYIIRNVTTGNSVQPGELTQVWHLAANTVLVALATCATLACGCCCSVLMAMSWRGRRRRKGRYKTTLSGKRGSMRLIKYVIVRESS